MLRKKRRLLDILEDIEDKYGVCERELCKRVDEQIQESPHLSQHREDPNFWYHVAQKQKREPIGELLRRAKAGELSDIERGSLILRLSGYK